MLIVHTPGLQPTGQHVFVRLRRKAPRETISEEDRENAEFEETRVVEGEMVQRAYTPVSSASAKGHIDLLIKLYLANETWRNGGKMTTGFHELELGDEIEFKGPLGSFTYLERGLCRWRGVERKVKTFGMICAGSGITPILQVVREIVDGDAKTGTGSEDLPKVWCVDSNRKEEDIREYRSSHASNTRPVAHDAFFGNSLSPRAGRPCRTITGAFPTPPRPVCASFRLARDIHQGSND